MFYDKLFSSLDFTLPRATTGRRGFPKEAMVCAFIVMKCEGFAQITDLVDYLDNKMCIRDSLNLVLSCVAAIQAPLIMMSQNCLLYTSRCV